jgi:hypothetical protein
LFVIFILALIAAVAAAVYAESNMIEELTRGRTISLLDVCVFEVLIDGDSDGDSDDDSDGGTWFSGALAIDVDIISD